jgi:hypothetical protein
VGGHDIIESLGVFVLDLAKLGELALIVLAVSELGFDLRFEIGECIGCMRRHGVR